MKHTALSYVYVGGQWVTFGLIAITGPLIVTNPFWFMVEILSVALGLWAIVTMRRISVFNITPDVKQEAHFVARGPYRFIRHPMYTAVIIVSFALVANSPSLIRIAFFFAVVLVHLLKLRYEEGLLVKRFPAYPEYQKRTARLIPFLF